VRVIEYLVFVKQVLLRSSDNGRFVTPAFITRGVKAKIRSCPERPIHPRATYLVEGFQARVRHKSAGEEATLHLIKNDPSEASP
jgi:hypothetical protein